MTLYGRPGCHLCDEAAAIVEQVRARRGFEIEKVDISGDPGLEIAYGSEIPIVAIDGVPRFKVWVDEGALEAALDVVAAHAGNPFSP